MGKITVLGLGPGSVDDLTIRAIKELENAKCLCLRTKFHPTVKYIEDRGLSYISFDDYYERFDSFEEVYDEIAKMVIKYAREYDVLYAVPGHPLVAEDTVQRILVMAKSEKIDVEIISSMSFLDAVIKSLLIDPIEGLMVLDGLSLEKHKIDVKAHNIITQVYNKRVASDVKLKLMEYYDDETEVSLIRAAGIKGEEKLIMIPLYDIDKIDWVDHLTSLYIPPVSKKRRYDFEDLVAIMDKLRSPEGCPWDKEQTHESLKQYLLEESYEVLEAIDDGDMDKVCEELGDLLLQVVFHARIAKENEKFDIYDVTNSITQKMINRHTHIFGDDVCKTASDVLNNWDALKRKEQKLKTTTDTLKHIPKNMPALMRSYKVQDKASKIGFDWDSVEGAINKVNEELQEFMEVYKSEKYGRIIDELGDLLFAIVNVCRFENVIPEFALNAATNKFIKRFEYIETKANESGRKLEEMNLDEMDVLWNEAKMNNF